MAKYVLKINGREYEQSSMAKDMAIKILNYISESSTLENLELDIDYDNGDFTSLDILIPFFRLSQSQRDTWTEQRILACIESGKSFIIGE